MQARPGGAPASPPFFNRRSVLRLSAVTALGVLLLAGVKPTQNPTGFLIALVLAATLVGVILTYVGGCMLAWRSRSLLWLFVVFLLPPPMGAAAVALFGTPPDARTGIGRR